MAPKPRTSLINHVIKRYSSTKTAALEWAESAGPALGIKDLSDWYSISSRDLRSAHQMSTLSHKWGGSLSTALRQAYPDHSWQIWKFKTTPRGWNTDIEHQREVFDNILKQTGMVDLAGWYLITRRQVAEMGGGYILSKFYNNSVLEALKNIYPDYEWLPWKFPQAHRFWRTRENHRLYMDWAARQQNITLLGGWYDVTNERFLSLDGSAELLGRYNQNLSSALTAIYPDHSWNLWMFQTVPKGVFDNEKQRRAYLEWLGQRLGYVTMEDWYSISGAEFNNNRGSSLLKHYFNGSASRAVRETFPEHTWDPHRFGRP